MQVLLASAENREVDYRATHQSGVIAIHQIPNAINAFPNLLCILLEDSYIPAGNVAGVDGRA